MLLKDLINAIAEQNPDLLKKDIKAVLDSLPEVLHNHFVKGEGTNLTLKGIGTFSKVSLDERTYRNVQTGEPVVVAAHDEVKFKLAKSLRKAFVAE